MPSRSVSPAAKRVLEGKISNSTATISAQPQPVGLCIAANADTSVNSTMDCASAAPAPAVNLSLAGLGLVGVGLKANVSQAPNTGWGDETIAATQIGQNPQTDTSGNSPPRVATQSLFGSILNSNLNQLTATATILGITVDVTAIAMPLLAPTLSVVGQTLDGVLSPLLELLGIQLGYADIKLLSLDCDSVELVF